MYNNNMVEVFKTNVINDQDSVRLIQLLKQHFPQGHINFDLEDCDKILRIEDQNVSTEKTIQVMNAFGYHCEVLEG